MRRLTLAFLLLATPAGAQDVPVQPVSVSPAEGNWGCIALIDNTKAGLLTIFAGSYGYASANFGSKASGTGNAKMGSDGVAFLDGTLTDVGIVTGIVTFDAAGNDTLTLNTAEKPVLVCTPR
jgi:hypothetical protein